MRLDTRAFAFAAGATAATLYTLCALAVAISPAPMTAFFSTVTHLDLTRLGRPLTWGGFVVGLTWWTAYAAAAFGLASAIYNRLTRQPRFVPSPSRHAVA